MTYCESSIFRKLGSLITKFGAFLDRRNFYDLMILSLNLLPREAEKVICDTQVEKENK